MKIFWRKLERHLYGYHFFMNLHYFTTRMSRCETIYNGISGTWTPRSIQTVTNSQRNWSIKKNNYIIRLRFAKVHQCFGTFQPLSTKQDYYIEEDDQLRRISRILWQIKRIWRCVQPQRFIPVQAPTIRDTTLQFTRTFHFRSRLLHNNVHNLAIIIFNV